MQTLFNILLAAQILICVAMAGLILIQRSEGGALGTGGGPSGFMSARGAGNLLTRMTGILAVLFFANSIGMTIVGNRLNKTSSAVDSVDTSKLPTTTPSSAAPPAQTVPQQSSSSAAPSLTELPMGNAPTVAPVQQPTAPKASNANRQNSTTVVLPTTSGLSSSSVSAKDVSKAKSSIWDTSSSSSASKAASSTPQ